MPTGFHDDGLLRLPAAIDVDAVRGVRSELWREVGERFGIGRDQPESWFANPGNPAGDPRGRRLSGMTPIMESLQNAAVLDAFESSLRSVVGEALSPQRWVAKPSWYSLLSFPGTRTVWDVPHASWHADEPAAAGHALPWTVFAFVFLETVPARGGGTVVVTGSHRCAQRLARRIGRVDTALVEAFADDNRGLVTPDALRLVSPLELVDLLAQQSAWFAKLVSEGAPAERVERFMRKGALVDGVPVRVVELTGAPGDVVLLDPRCIHSASANTSGVPRELLRLDFRRVPSPVGVRAP